MSLRDLPQARLGSRPQAYQADVPSDLLAQWAARPLAAAEEEAAPNTITIYDVIGEDIWTGGGFTAKRMAAALRSIGPKAVRVKINSPGGDMFEGAAIYNELRQHAARVSIDVMGLAASAASTIAMAGDEIRMGLGTHMLIHNAWGIVVGNRNDMRAVATWFETFDDGLVDVYEARTGLDRKTIAAMMDAKPDGTLMNAARAVEKGFADRVDDTLRAPPGEAESRFDTGLMARRRIEAALAKAGHKRPDRSEMISGLVNAAARDAGRTAARDAGRAAAAQRLIETMRSQEVSDR